MAMTPFAKIDPARLRDVFYFVKRRLVIFWKWLTGTGSLAFVLALGVSVLLYANLEKFSTEGSGEKDGSSVTDSVRTPRPTTAQGGPSPGPAAMDSMRRQNGPSGTPSGNTLTPPMVVNVTVSPVDTVGVQTQQDEFYQQRIGSEFPAWVRNFYLFAGFVLVFGLYESRKQQRVRKDLERDRDPQELEALFRYFTGPVIRNLSTPRKLKRFSNKVRLQYKLIEQSAAHRRRNLLHSDEVNLMVGGMRTTVRRNALWFFFLMMLVEFNRKTTLLSGQEFATELLKLIESGTAGMDEAFQKIVQEYAGRDLRDDPIVATLYELNRNSLI
jgi:hypothetical protein